MPKSARIISLNLGSQTLGLAEFQPQPHGGLILRNYRLREMMTEPAAEGIRRAQISAALREMMAELGLAGEPVNYAVSAQSVFARFVKLPAVEEEKIERIIAFEAQQNVPFPIDEVVWDYQLVGGGGDEQIQVVLVAIKADLLDETNGAVEDSGLRTAIVDVATMALYNAFRYNYDELSGCSLLVDIGARTTNLLFIEPQKIFSRSVPIGGSSVTAAISKEFGEPFAVADFRKKRDGFVSLNDTNPDEKKGVDIVLRLAPLGQIAPPAIPVEPAPPNQTGTAPGAPPEAAPPSAVTTPIPAKPIVAPALVSAAPIAPSEARITITLNQIPLGEALRYIAAQAGLKVKVEPYAVSIIPITEQSNDLITKEYRVPPGFISTSVNVGPSALQRAAYKTGEAAPAAAGGATGTGKDTEESTGGHQLVNREGAREFLESQGVPFPPGASAHFLPQSSRLIVRNTADNLELVDAIVEQASVAGPKQVEIEAKFVEINQNNWKELGFDWLLGQFNVGNHKLFAGGGTSGTGSPVNPADWPFVPPGSTNPVGQFPVTAGNRSGEFAISANAIDALLFPNMGASALAPGIFGLSGVFTDPQFQVVIRALNQKKGIDLLSAPKITTKSGQRAVIEIVREFRYPTQFTEPKVPDIQGRGSSSSTTTTIALPVVGPSTPSNFETRNTGVTLEVEPVVGPDGITIDLNLVPQVVEFEGFINYGSPIKTVNPALLGFSPSTLLGTTTEAITLTDNVINQPIFSTRKVTTSVSVWDGQTVVLGGLMREDVQKVEDRTPFIGDLPLVGRLFRTNVDQHIKRNLIIFVTARLVNPAGQPVNQVEEEEEAVTPPELPAYKK